MHSITWYCVIRPLRQQPAVSTERLYLDSRTVNQRSAGILYRMTYLRTVRRIFAV